MPHRSRFRGGILRRACTVAGTLGLGAALLGGMAATPASAIPIPPSTSAATEADLSTGTSVTTSATGTLTATITVTATGGTPGFKALDHKAVCPPTQAQVNAGLTNCVVTVANLATSTGLNFGNFQLVSVSWARRCV